MYGRKLCAIYFLHLHMNLINNAWKIHWCIKHCDFEKELIIITDMYIFSFPALCLQSLTTYSTAIIIFKCNACKIKCMKKPWKNHSQISWWKTILNRAIASHQRLLKKSVQKWNIKKIWRWKTKKNLFNLWFCSIIYFSANEKKNADIFQHGKKYKFY